jgi:hypothetical protein
MKMSRSLLLVSCLIIGLLVLACSKQEETNRNGTNRNAASTTAPAAASPVATVSTSAEQVGVPECDNFINAYEACVNGKVPEQARAQFNSALKTWRTEWKKLAANPQTKAGLVTACKTQLESARQSMKAYNCTF